MSPEKGNLIQIWLRGAVSGGFGPALSEFDAAGVPAPAASSVERCSHLANQQASASHNGIIVNSAFLAPRTNALTSEHVFHDPGHRKRAFAQRIPKARPRPHVSGIVAMCLPY
jgi:hypothetical protein